MALDAAHLAPDDLLERGAELRAVEDALDAALEGRGALVVVEGEAGIGKSRLLAHAGDLARERGLQVLTARGGESEGDFPFGAALQLFEARMAGAALDERAQLLAGAAGLAAELLEGPPWGRTLPGDHDAVFSLVHGLYWLAANLADRAPLLLVIDDAHWADAASLRFAAYLAHRLDGLPVAVVLGVRTGEPTASGELRALSGDPSATVLTLGALSPDATAEFVRAHAFPDAEDAFCAACFEATRGNPFLVRELLLTLRDDDVDPTAASAARIGDVAPDTIARSILLRLARFPPDALALARAVAILFEADVPQAAALAGIDADEAAGAAALLARASILAEEEPLVFAHPVLRSAVHGDMAGAERRRAHLRAARLLHADGAPAERVARHLLDAPAAGEPWAVETLRHAAARTVERGARELPARLLRRALDEPAARPERAELLIELGTALAATRTAEAAVAYDQALVLLDDPHRVAEVQLALGQALFGSGRHLEAGAAYRRGLEAAGDEGDCEIGRQLAAGLAMIGIAEPALHEETVALRSRIADGADELSAGERAVLSALAVRAGFGIEPHERARDLARRALGDGALVPQETAEGMHWTLANAVLVWADDLGSSIAACDAALADARTRGSVMGFANASACRAAPLFWSGRVADAAADATQALAHRADGWGMWVPLAVGVLTWALVEGGDLAAAEDALASGGEPEAQHALLAAYLLHARGRLRAAQGRWDEALGDHLAAGAALPNPNPGALPWRSSAAVAASRCGDAERAAALAAEEVELARRWGAPRPLGMALRAQGLVAGGAEGTGLLHDAVDMLRRSPARLELARALADHGAALRRAGYRTSSADVLREALDLADRSGAHALAATAREELVLAGGRPRRAARDGAEALTAGERRVVVLAAQGLTNRQIAESLFVSRKTVEWHLRGAYRKLGVNRRADLERLLGDEPVTG